MYLTNISEFIIFDHLPVWDYLRLFKFEVIKNDHFTVYDYNYNNYAKQKYFEILSLTLAETAVWFDELQIKLYFASISNCLKFLINIDGFTLNIGVLSYSTLFSIEHNVLSVIKCTDPDEICNIFFCIEQFDLNDRMSTVQETFPVIWTRF